jgi:hypothetical protein
MKRSGFFLPFFAFFAVVVHSSLFFVITHIIRLSLSKLLVLPETGNVRLRRVVDKRGVKDL